MYVYKVDGLGQEGREEQQVREEHFQKYFLFFFYLLGHQSIIRGCKLGTVRWERCTG